MTNAGELVAAGFNKLGYIQYAGIDELGFGPGQADLVVTPEPRLLNHNGDIHAANLFGLAETAATGAAVTAIFDLLADAYVVVKTGRIDYLARAQGDAGPFRVRTDLTEQLVQGMRDDVQAGNPIEMPVPVTISDSTGKDVAAAEFAVIIRRKR
ncbi:DUF4442 domain-containing protein [Jongsikchunia kroppenstedtii]|uniref:DUF4442 domain-containing protein n=1 Tax=Jongsikchunia kroppenstedtii TaxID=1121721 RepID=UPI0003729796|nr:DUF4442 domain-containing protein [Jongsikchunia kroppenstedtii]